MNPFWNCSGMVKLTKKAIAYMTNACFAPLKKIPPNLPKKRWLKIYKKLRPGEPPTVESARNLFDNLFFDPRRYDLARVGRYKLNKKLGWRQRMLGQTLAQPIVNMETGEIIVDADTVMNEEQLDIVANSGDFQR